MRARFGLDRPLSEQIVRYIRNVAVGDFGYSYTYGQPVFAVTLERVPATLLLMLTAQALAIIGGLGIGAWAAGRGDSRVSQVIRAGAALGYALPVFWIGQLFVLLFAFRLSWFPVYRMESLRAGYEGLRRVPDIAYHLALPAAALALVELGVLIRLMDATMREVAREDYVRLARAKGLSEGAVIRRHMLRNALLPVVTVIGSRIGMRLTGAVLVEIVFAWPGLGRLLYDAALARDYPLLMAMFFFSALSAVLGNLQTDLVYVRLDPRIRYR